jgi:hypothetical protein
MQEAVEGLYVPVTGVAFTFWDPFGPEYTFGPFSRTVNDTTYTKCKSIQTIDVLDLVSEGEIFGFPQYDYHLENYGTGGHVGYQNYPTDNSARTNISPTSNVYYNDVPIQNEQGQYNFSFFDYDISLGNSQGTTSEGNIFSSTESKYLSRTIGTRLYASTMENASHPAIKPLVNPPPYQDMMGVNSYANDEDTSNFVHYTVMYEGKWFTASDVSEAHPYLQPLTTEFKSILGSRIDEPFGAARTMHEIGEAGGNMAWPKDLPIGGEPPDYPHANAQVFRISNRECAGVVIIFRIGGLLFQVLQGYDDLADQGDTLNNTIYAHATYRPVFKDPKSPLSVWKKTPLYPKTVTMTGKITSQTFYSMAVDFDPYDIEYFKNYPDLIGWEIMIYRSTADSIHSYNRSDLFIDSILEKYFYPLKYPYSAIVRSSFSAEFFSSIPTRSYNLLLKKVRVPEGYDTITRTYPDIWNGVFSSEKKWSNNPVWCYYDLMTNRRYGLGDYIKPSQIDKWTLYQIAQYCDTLVEDGYGGLEPRFTFNWWFTSREEAYKIMQDMSSVFNSMIYYNCGAISTIQDSPKEPVYLFTNANVEDGDFQYSSSAKRDRHSVAIVRYNDKFNLYKPAIEYVEDIDAIRKYGIREKELTAFGCSSRGQAIRLGRWILLSETLETEIINFTAGQEASILRPGDVFGVFDAHRQVRKYAGRTMAITGLGAGLGTKFVLDRTVGELDPQTTYSFKLLTPTYNYDNTEITDLDSSDIADIRRSHIQSFNFSGLNMTTGNGYSYLTVTGDINTSGYNITDSSIWTIDLANGANYNNEVFEKYHTNYYRVVKITEKEGNKYDVGGLQYSPEKFSLAESGVAFSTGHMVNIEPKVPLSPLKIKDTWFWYNLGDHHVYYDYGLYGGLSFGLTPSSPSLESQNVDTILVYATGQQASVGNPNGYPAYVESPMFQQNTMVPPLGNLVYIRNGPQNSIEQETNIPFLTRMDNYAFNSLVKFKVFTRNNATNTYCLTPFITGILLPKLYYYGPNVLPSSKIGGLRYSETSEKGRKIISNSYNPTFTWQLAFTGVPLDTEPRFRATIRPPTYTDATPIYQTGYYETTGIGTSFTFDFDTNKGLIGGPYRDYDVVIEYVDSQGNTSTNSTMGSFTGDFSRPFSYDVITLVNPRQTGIELSTSIPTAPYSGAAKAAHSGSHISSQWIGPNGDISIHFHSGLFNEDLVGGYIYVSSGEFPKREAVLANTGDFRYTTGNLCVYRYKFSDFSKTNPYIYHPYAAQHIKGLPTGYISVSFTDWVDDFRIQTRPISQHIESITGLYVSDNALILNKAEVGTLTFSETLEIKRMNNESVGSIKLVNDGGVTRLVTVDKNGDETIMSSSLT